MKSHLQSNVVINLIRTISLTILSFITFPYVCRILGATALGQYSWATAFVYYFLILARISIPNIAVRECTKVKNDPDKLSMKVQEFFIIQVITTLLSFGLMCAIMFMVPSLRENSTLIFIISINFLAGVLSFEWLYTALEKHTYMAVRSIIISMIVDIFIILLIRPNEDFVYLYSFLCISVTLLTVITNLVYLPFNLKFTKKEKYNFKQYIPLLGTLFLISLVTAIYEKTDTFILGFIDPSKASVGSYSVSIKGIEIVIGLMTALSTIFIPRASYYLSNNDNRQYKNLNKYSVNLCLLITIPALALMIALAEPITELISGNYSSSSSQFKDISFTLIALSSVMVTYSLCNIINTQILIPQKKEKYYLYTILSGSILNVGFSLLFSLVFMKNNPAIGVAIGTSITDLIMLIILISLTWKDSKEIIFNINNLKILLVGIALGVGCYILSPIIKNSLLNQLGYELTYFLQILIIFFGFAICYFVLLIIVKEKLLRSKRHKVVNQ